MRGRVALVHGLRLLGLLLPLRWLLRKAAHHCPVVRHCRVVTKILLLLEALHRHRLKWIRLLLLRRCLLLRRLVVKCAKVVLRLLRDRAAQGLIRHRKWVVSSSCWLTLGHSWFRKNIKQIIHLSVRFLRLLDLRRSTKELISSLLLWLSGRIAIKAVEVEVSLLLWSALVDC